MHLIVVRRDAAAYQHLPAPIARASGDGYGVRLRAPGLRAGRESELSFRVIREGRVEPALEPYLGAKGTSSRLAGVTSPTSTSTRRREHRRLTAPTVVRARMPISDGRKAGAGDIRFAATFPTAGRYRLFLQFRAAGRVRTVDYTLEGPR